MGINSLHKLLRNNCPQVYEEIHLSEYAYKKVAIDISLYLCKFKVICGTKWLSAFINLIACLRRNEIHCIFIYDSGYPPEKEEERKERARQRAKNEERVYILEDAINDFHKTGIVNTILTDTYNKKIKQPKRLLSLTDTHFSIKVCEDALLKMKSYILNIKPEDFALTKKLFDILDVPYCHAPLEAETMCADLCIRGEVDSVMSEDTDVLAYGAPDFLTKINTSTDTCVRIKYQDVLDGLELKSEQFLDVCIMCGCDYNKNIFRVGPEKAYKYIQKYKSIEEISTNTKHDISILNHVRGRELFRGYEKKNIKIEYCGTPDFKELAVFIVQNNVSTDIESLKKSFTNAPIVFENDDNKDTKILLST
jgi:5'-3' exonuclease